MSELVLDASVVLKWFAPDEERHSAEAHVLRADLEAGRLAVVVPRLLHLEVINVAARSWAWPEYALVELASAIDDLLFDVREPDMTSVAVWAARGLTAYDAAYVALAERWGLELVTDDESILQHASPSARPLAARAG